MLLNSVAPNARASSRNVLAENPGSSTRPARPASDPSVEYAGALMWNSGSEVITRSSGVSRIHHGKPSPAITYARWVCITNFERPVVPDVGIITATSFSSTDVGPRPSASASYNDATSTTRAAEPTSGARSGSVTTSAGSTCPTKPATSASELFGLIGTWIAPVSISANQLNR